MTTILKAHGLRRPDRDIALKIILKLKSEIANQPTHVDKTLKSMPPESD